MLEKDSLPAASAGRGAFLMEGYYRRVVSGRTGHQIALANGPSWRSLSSEVSCLPL